MEKRKAPDGAAVPGDLIGNIMGGYAPPFVLQVLAAAQAQPSWDDIIRLVHCSTWCSIAHAEHGTLEGFTFSAQVWVLGPCNIPFTLSNHFLWRTPRRRLEASWWIGSDCPSHFMWRTGNHYTEGWRHAGQ